MEEILVFKTDASEQTDLEALRRLFSREQKVRSWNFDFDDCDNIFRLVSAGITCEEVITMLASLDIRATEL
ncbi:hypothetical protein [Compostibacter hankyongensis]|uniref:Uncharacterized protein n=1 Tax=Compostibacter hankyongensis TaxID=1007089 RepID=A0ABP8FLU4_9BACT